MNIVLPLHSNNSQNITKFTNHLINESVKAGDTIVDKIKNGFLSLLKSISNSFKCLVKLFSFSNGNSHVNTNEKPCIYFEGVPSVAIEVKETAILEENPLRAARQEEFNKLKAEMHAKLGTVFKHQINH